MWTFWIVGALAGEAPDLVCPDDPPTALVEASRAVEASWLGLDGPGFDVARIRLDVLPACLDVPLTVDQVVAWHRARALVAYVSGDTAAARRAFAAVHALEPGWSLPPEVPPEHPLHALVAAAAAESPATVPFRVTPPHGWVVDGTAFPRVDDLAPGLPKDRAFVLQVLDEDGAVAWSGYLLSAADVPVDAIPLRLDDEEVRRRRRRDARIWGGVIGGALLAGSGVAFGLGWTDRTAVAAGDVALEDVTRTQARANTLGGVAYGLAGGGALALTLGLAVPW